MYLHLWERYGLDRANSYYLKDQKVIPEEFYKHNLYSILSGKLDFLRMVRGSEDLVYKKLLSRFKKLNPVKNKEEKKYVSVDEGVDVQDFDERFKEHCPADVAGFLRLFQDSVGLKYLTHDFDQPGKVFYLENILELANRELNTAFKKYSITKPLYARVKQFAFEKKPNWWRWKNGKLFEIHKGWSTDEIVEWTKANPGIHPIRVKKFRDEFIQPFKDSIQVRTPKLKQLIRECIREKFTDETDLFNVTEAGLENADFYTDVDRIFGGIRHLLDGIRERIDVSKEIKITYMKYKNQERVEKIIEIIHVGSECYKDAFTGELMNGNFKEANSAFHGLCNWSITAKFADGCFKLHILSDIHTLPSREPIDSTNITGFTHTLSFY